MNPKISIIVPIFNVETYIQSCIDSILVQTFVDFELILVNDGSTDDSGQICDEFAEKDGRVKVIHKKNGGVSSARNIGINIGKGEYIAFVDPDDEIEPDMYSILIQQATRLSADIVVCPIRTFNRIINRVSISSVWEEDLVLDKETIENKFIPTILTSNNYSILSSVNKLYKKQWFDQLDLRFDEEKNHGEDARLNLILLTYINRLAFVKQPLYNYFIRNGNSLTQIFREDLYEYILDNKNFGISLCKKYRIAHNIDNYLRDFIISTLNYMQDVVHSKQSKDKKYKILNRIMNDKDFKQYLLRYKSPSTYYMLLQTICKV